MDELYDAGELKLSHGGMARARARLIALVNERDISRTNLKAKPRGGAKVTIHVVPSNSTLLKKYRAYRDFGRSMQPFFPKKGFGRRPAHFDYDSLDFLRQAVLRFASPERPSKTEVFRR